MDFLLIFLWLGAGLLTVGIMNHSFRYKYRSLYIKGYWYHNDPNEATYNFDMLDLSMAAVTVLAGPIALLAAIGFKTFTHSNVPFGLCYKFTAWTMEEALKEFPDDKDLRFRASRVSNEKSTSGSPTSYEV